jgi:cell division septum initiation protein DivIVA
MTLERKVHEAAGKARKVGFSADQVQALVGLVEAVYAYRLSKSYSENSELRKEPA